MSCADPGGGAISIRLNPKISLRRWQLLRMAHFAGASPFAASLYMNRRSSQGGSFAGNSAQSSPKVADGVGEFLQEHQLPDNPTIVVVSFVPDCLCCAYQFAIVVDSASITERTSRRIPLSRRSHITGFQPLATGVAEHESALERDFVTLTAFVDARASITSQPITLSFRHEGRARRYTADFLVRWCSRRTELIEVKYQADLDANKEELRPAFDAARAWANENGAVFRAVTEHEIRGPTLVNAKRLLPLRKLPIDREIAIRLLTAVGSLEMPTFGQIVAAQRVNRGVAVATVWRLIARGQLRVDVTTAITLNTRLALP